MTSVLTYERTRLLEKYDRPTDQPTNKSTDRQTNRPGHREVILEKKTPEEAILNFKPPPPKKKLSHKIQELLFNYF